MKNLLSIVSGTILLSSSTVFGQTDPSRNYKMPAHDRQVVKKQDIVVNKNNVSFANSFDSPQNYKHQVFKKKQNASDFIVMKNLTEQAESEFNPHQSNRNYKTQTFGKVKIGVSNSNTDQLATTKNVE